MPYYQILKQRRLDLNLSVQDIAIQTRLKPEYIRAIEENNLDIFSDDFSYVRYFVHGYCDAIGVNWNAVKDEVDATISAYAAARDRALAQAQVKMIQSMPAARPTRKTARKTRKKRKRSFLSNHAGRLSRTLTWGNQNRLARLLLICAAVAIAVLFGLNALAENAARASSRQDQLAREQELKDKEEQTQKLASDLQNRKSDDTQQPAAASAVTVSADPYASNTFSISGFTAETPTVSFQITPVSGETVTILWNSTPAYSQTVTQPFTYDLSAGTSGTATVIFSVPNASNSLSVQGSEIPADYAAADENGTCRVTLQIVYPQADDQTQTVQDDQSVPAVQNEAQYAADNGTGAYAGYDQTDPYAQYPYEDQSGYQEVYQ